MRWPWLKNTWYILVPKNLKHLKTPLVNLVLRTSGDLLRLWPYCFRPFGDYVAFFPGVWKANPSESKNVPKTYSLPLGAEVKAKPDDCRVNQLRLLTCLDVEI